MCCGSLPATLYVPMLREGRGFPLASTEAPAEPDVLRIVAGHVVRADAERGQGIPVGIHRGSRRARGLVAAALDVAQHAGARGGRVDRAAGGGARARAQLLNLHEEERLVLDHRSAHAAAEDILLELGFAKVGEVVLP